MSMVRVYVIGPGPDPLYIGQPTSEAMLAEDDQREQFIEWVKGKLADLYRERGRDLEAEGGVQRVLTSEEEFRRGRTNGAA
jgi:hypothetical protein